MTYHRRLLKITITKHIENIERKYLKIEHSRDL